MSLLVAPLASIAAATTAQLRILVVITLLKIDVVNLAKATTYCEGDSRHQSVQLILHAFC